MTYGVCASCGAVAWELLSGISDYCMGCDSATYQPPDDDEYDEEWWDEPDDPSGPAAGPTTSKETR